MAPSRTATTGQPAFNDSASAVPDEASSPPTSSAPPPARTYEYTQGMAPCSTRGNQRKRDDRPDASTAPSSPSVVSSGGTSPPTSQKSTSLVAIESRTAISTKLAQSLSGQDANMEDAAKAFADIADQVPDEIKDDYEVIAENFSKIADALKDVDLTSGQTPSPEALAKLQELSASMDSAEVRQASQHIEAWVQEHC